MWISSISTALFIPPGTRDFAHHWYHDLLSRRPTEKQRQAVHMDMEASIRVHTSVHLPQADLKHPLEIYHQAILPAEQFFKRCPRNDRRTLAVNAMHALGYEAYRSSAIAKCDSAIMHARRAVPRAFVDFQRNRGIRAPPKAIRRAGAHPRAATGRILVSVPTVSFKGRSCGQAHKLIPDRADVTVLRVKL